jgi:flagellin-like protein
MKGITPIVSIIVLLLITISLAGLAYVFFGGLVGTMMGRTLVVSQGSCINTDTAYVQITNVGTSSISVTSPCSVTGKTATCGQITVVREDSGSFGTVTISSTTLAPGGDPTDSVATFQDDGCGAGNTCRYAFNVGSSSVKATATC